ncbi:UNVERIFIED_CONTAM: hypothetical protein RMT77_019183 [Armadillidium vulgare]
MPKNRDKKCKQLTQGDLAEKLKKEENLDEMSHIFSEMSKTLKIFNQKVRKPTKLIENFGKLIEEHQRQKENPLRSEEESQTLDEKILYIEEKLKVMLQQCENVENYYEDLIQKNNAIRQKLLECQNKLSEEKEQEISAENFRELLQNFEKNCQDLMERIDYYREYEDEISKNIEILQDLKEKPQHLEENPPQRMKSPKN